MSWRSCDNEMLKQNCLVRWVIYRVHSSVLIRNVDRVEGLCWILVESDINEQGQGGDDEGGLEWANRNSCWILVVVVSTKQGHDYDDEGGLEWVERNVSVEFWLNVYPQNGARVVTTRGDLK